MTAPRPCPEFEPLLLDRVAGSMDAAAAARLETHLAGCEACRVEAAALAAALAAARLPPPSESELRALDRAQVATLRHWRGGEGARRNRSLLQGFSAGFAVAAAAAVLVIAPGAYRRAQQVHLGAPVVQKNGSSVPGNGGKESAGTGIGATVPGSVVSGGAGSDANAAAWEPDLDEAWETAALALGEDLGDEEVAATDVAELYDLDDQ